MTMTDTSYRQCERIVPGGICVRCAGRQNPHNRLSCIYESLMNMVLFRTTTDPSSRKPYRQLAREDVYLSPALDAVRSRKGPWITIHLSQGPGAIPLSVLPFDQTKALSLVPPKHKELYTHPYALAPDARKVIEQFLDRNYAKYMNYYLNQQNNELDLMFFRAAVVEVKYPTIEMVSSSSSVLRFGSQIKALLFSRRRLETFFETVFASGPPAVLWKGAGDSPKNRC